MLIVFIACLVGLVIVLVALARDEPLAAPGPPAPAFDALPTPADVVRARFPLAWPGYDPAAVEVHLDAVARAWADLLAVAPPEVVERARQLTLLRQQIGVERMLAAYEHATTRSTPSSTLAGSNPDADQEALRTEAALELIQATRAPLVGILPVRAAMTEGGHDDDKRPEPVRCEPPSGTERVG